MSDIEFLNYVRIHSQNPRPLFSKEMIARLFDLAKSPPEQFHIPDGNWIQLDYETAIPLIELAEEHLSVEPTKEEAVIEDPVEILKRYQSVIRKIRDQRGDDRCWKDLEELYSLLPEGYTPPERDTLVELENCKRYIESQQNPATVYVSPQREIELLESEVKALKMRIELEQ